MDAVSTTILAISGVALLYLVVSPRFGERLYHGPLFEPWRYPRGNYESDFATSANLLDLTVVRKNGHKLHAWLVRKSPSTKIIMVCHGNTGNITDLDRLVSILDQLDTSFVVFDYSGFGKSEGSPSVATITEDGLTLFDWLVESQKYSPSDVFLYGESLGGSVACQIASQRQIAGLILQSTFSSFRKVSTETIPFLGLFPEFLYPQPYFGNAKILSELQDIPVLIIHGKKDPEINFAHAEQLHAASKSSKKKLLALPETLHDEIHESDVESVIASLKNVLQISEQLQESILPS